MPATSEEQLELQRQFGQAIASRRTQLGLSQEQFATRVAVDRTYVSKLERGLSFPSRGVAVQIAQLASSDSEEFLALWTATDQRRRLLSSADSGRDDGISEDFVAFVGLEIAHDAVALVYPVFELSPDAQARLTDINPQRLYSKVQSPFQGEYRIDVPAAVAANDVRALLYIAELLQRYVPVRTHIRTDTDVTRDCNCSFFSFGLSSNDCTHMYFETAKPPMFEIVDDDHDSEYLRIADGTEFRSTAREQFGIIVRARPDPVDHPERCWFLCAGLGPCATPGAGWYLASHWQALHERVGEADFVAVIRTG